MYDVMQFLGAILTAGLFVAAQCQLFDRSEIQDGDTFKLICEASRIGSVPQTVTTLYSLSIERTVSGTEVELIAIYSPGLSKNLTKNIPGGRQWVIEASGGRGTIHPDYNRASIKLTLYVPDAQCADTGLYSCNANFPPVDGLSSAGRSQTLTSKAKTDVPVLTLEHHNGNDSDVSKNTEGQDVKLTCSFEGPGGLVLTWMIGPIRGTNFVPHESNHDVQMVTPSPITNPCERGKYTSTLTFKVLAVDMMYICVARDTDGEISRKTFKIVVIPKSR
ncbi:unnamed protein product [Lymnaea stagnalis]|uniref:Ig-like domain-containing protein n=1 Tax=Lymnaea stagnalis TaxID=6523 RepID=A0AAV2IN45_LYMST